MIKMQIIGNLGKDCVVNNVNGRNVINFTVAHTEKFKDSQGNAQERTTWVDCAWWTDRTAITPYLIKGKQIFVEGQPEVRSFTRNDGTPGAALSVRVREVQLLGARGDGAAPQSNTGGNTYLNSNTPSDTASSNAPVSNTDFEEPIDDMPF